MDVIARISKKLEPLFEKLTELGTPVFLFGYAVQPDGEYTVCALARKLDGEIQIRTKLHREWTPTADLASAGLRQLLHLTWDIQHIFQEITTAQPLPSYCWCGFHEQQHRANDNCPAHGLSWQECTTHLNSNSNREICRLYQRMKVMEVRFHKYNLCTNPNGCGLNEIPAS